MPAAMESARTMSGLLRTLPAEPAPDLLRARIERALGDCRRRSPSPLRLNMRWGAMAASLIVAVGIGWLGGSFLVRAVARPTS